MFVNTINCMSKQNFIKIVRILLQLLSLFPKVFSPCNSRNKAMTTPQNNNKVRLPCARCVGGHQRNIRALRGNTKRARSEILMEYQNTVHYTTQYDIQCNNHENKE